MNSARISESERYEPAGTAANLSKFTPTGPDADRKRSDLKEDILPSVREGERTREEMEAVFFSGTQPSKLTAHAQHTTASSQLSSTISLFLIPQDSPGYAAARPYVSLTIKPLLARV